MKIRLNEDYYQWCCDWCDSENRVLWARINDGVFCGACHRPQRLTNHLSASHESAISAGLC